jgi:glycosyltransferase involved in cell wall biosynthesis
MKENGKVAVIIAAYKEEGMIATVVKNVISHGHHNVIVVDDGSPDKTGEEAFKAGATVLRHPLNRGQGAALKTGIDFAVREGADAIVTFDADGQHDAAEIGKIAAPVLAGTADCALGSRFIGSATNIPFLRMLALKGGAFIMRIMYGVKLTDSHNGFRALSRKAAQAIDLRADRMEHASEIISEIGKKKLTYVEIPVHIVYTEYSIKGSKQGSLPAIRILWKMIVNKVMH